MENKFTTRTALILGEDGIKKLQNSHVLVIGVGGVGSFCAEALVRAGVGNITIVDYAKVEVTDINRQLPGLTSTLGKDKVEKIECIKTELVKKDGEERDFPVNIENSNYLKEE